MDRYEAAENSFAKSIARAKDLCEVHTFISNHYTTALDTSDILRASVVLGVSAFDFLMHEVFRAAVAMSYQGGSKIERLLVPFDAAIAAPEEQEALLDDYIRNLNSYKSFVEPGKYAEAMGHFVEAPWQKVGSYLNLEADAVKQRIRTIYRWRNRIVHEADIKPILGGIEAWPIEKKDVVEAIEYIHLVGSATVFVVRKERA